MGSAGGAQALLRAGSQVLCQLVKEIVKSFVNGQLLLGQK
jgi:hypothetical protein